ncbi:MAG TPA: hypothetical protein VD970_06690 [Acetobacteraceae bacterium]|nr:hypothetical protein [Acetobacteraceae bacterium]
MSEFVDRGDPLPLRGPFSHQQGHCWTVLIDPALFPVWDSIENGFQSPLALYEDGRKLLLRKYGHDRDA